MLNVLIEPIQLKESIITPALAGFKLRGKLALKNGATLIAHLNLVRVLGRAMAGDAGA